MTSTYTLDIRVTDGQGTNSANVGTPLTYDATFTVTIVDVNEPPILTWTSDVLYVDENSPSGTLVTELTSNDEDVGQSRSYSITLHEPSNVETEAFSDPRIVPDTGDGLGVGNGDQPAGLSLMCANGGHTDDAASSLRFCALRFSPMVNSILLFMVLDTL